MIHFPANFQRTGPNSSLEVSSILLEMDQLQLPKLETTPLNRTWAFLQAGEVAWMAFRPKIPVRVTENTRIGLEH